MLYLVTISFKLRSVFHLTFGNSWMLGLAEFFYYLAKLLFQVGLSSQNTYNFGFFNVIF